MNKRLAVALTASTLLATSETAVAEDELRQQRSGAARRIERAQQHDGESSQRLRAANGRLQDALARQRNARAELAEMQGAWPTPWSVTPSCAADAISTSRCSPTDVRSTPRSGTEARRFPSMANASWTQGRRPSTTETRDR